MSEIKLTEQSFHIHLDFPEVEPETKLKAASLLGGGRNPNSLLGSGTGQEGSQQRVKLSVGN